MIKQTIFKKTFFGYLIVILSLVFLTILVSFSAIKKFHIDNLASHLKQTGKVFSDRIKPVLMTRDKSKLQKITSTTAIEINARITIIDPQGIVLADSESDPSKMENHIGRPEIADAVSNNFGKSLRHSSTVKKEMLYVAVTIRDDQQSDAKPTLLSIVRFSLFTEDINILLNNIRSKILIITSLIILISLGLAVIFSRGITKPIKKILSLSREIAQGNFKKKIFIKSSSEIEELAENFNYMTNEINKLFTETTSRKEELSAIIDSIDEGLVVINSEDKITLYNKSFEAIAGTGKLADKIIWEEIREPEFIQVIEKTRNTKELTVKEISCFNSTFICSSKFLASKQEIVTILRDLSRVKQYEHLKKDLISNVSHELRTPLTAIKGYLETIDMGENNTIGNSPENLDYISIIRRHTDRLINIVGDLLTISELEKDETQLKFSEIALPELVKDVLPLYKVKAKAKNISIIEEVASNLPLIEADYFRIEQVLINLIDNAVKYTLKGQITISIKSENKFVEINITDSGIGIPEKEIPKIFERFYVVNKSRSRDMGGTGLGLSIVKHIIALHNGKINIESRKSSGTNIKILLPIKRGINTLDKI